ncbi:MAG: hypothetical protein RI897_3499 [Verrucomicrobiota bacterium]
MVEVAEGAEEGVGGGHAEAAEGGFADEGCEFLEEFEVLERAVPFTDAVEDIVHLAGADAAGDTFAAGFFHTELHEEAGDIDHAGGVVHDDEATGAHD